MRGKEEDEVGRKSLKARSGGKERLEEGTGEEG